MLQQVNNQALVAKPAQRRRYAFTTFKGTQHPKKHMLEAK
jgi:hypothetical protein